MISKDYKVLVVDDEDEVREMIRRILRFSNYQVIEARDGDEGLQKAVDEKPDLITLDIMMPGKDGFRLCAELKQHAATKHIPVVVLTVAGSRKKAMNAGADYYMNKLFSIDEFVKVINHLVGRRPSEQPSA
ncbi:response regulator transcription factor [bacterium]|nr:response regulator transcription factor [bacterium]